MNLKIKLGNAPKTKISRKKTDFKVDDYFVAGRGQAPPPSR